MKQTGPDETGTIPEKRPSKMCEAVFNERYVKRPDLWVIVSIIMALTGGTFAYVTAIENRLTKVEIWRDAQTELIIGKLDGIDKKIEQINLSK